MMLLMILVLLLLSLMVICSVFVWRRVMSIVIGRIIGAIARVRRIAAAIIIIIVVVVVLIRVCLRLLYAGLRLLLWLAIV